MPVVERYELQLLNGPRTTVERWTLEPAVPYGCLLMGGSLTGPEDWKHLSDDLGITHVLSLETEHDDRPFVPDAQVFWLPTPDDGMPKQPAWYALGCAWVDRVLSEGKSTRLYLHCQVGGSRTPAMLYAILRSNFGNSEREALSRITAEKPSFGTAPGHINYIASAEAFLAVAEHLPKTKIA